MQLTTEIIFEVITLLSTVLSFVWYMANQLAGIRSRLDRLEAVCKRLEKVEHNLEGVETNCREGRVKLWEQVNDSRMYIAEVKAKIER